MWQGAWPVTTTGLWSRGTLKAKDRWPAGWGPREAERGRGDPAPSTGGLAGSTHCPAAAGAEPPGRVLSLGAEGPPLSPPAKPWRPPAWRVGAPLGQNGRVSLVLKGSVSPALSSRSSSRGARPGPTPASVGEGGSHPEAGAGGGGGADPVPWKRFPPASLGPVSSRISQGRWLRWGCYQGAPQPPSRPSLPPGGHSVSVQQEELCGPGSVAWGSSGPPAQTQAPQTRLRLRADGPQGPISTRQPFAFCSLAGF